MGHTMEVIMRVFFNENQNVPDNDSFSPSAGKPKQVIESWTKLGIPFKTEKFSPVTREQLYQVHSKKYVDDVIECRTSNGFGNKNPLVAKALPWVCGSMVSASLHAYRTGETSFSPTSGAHHAHFDYGSGFCTFNFLVLAAVEAHKAGASKIGIIDLDCHPSDGILDIIEELGINYIQVYSFGYDSLAKNDPQSWVNENLRIKCYEFEGCDIVIFNAGVDPHVNDKLGGYLTTEQMRKRDEIVFQTMKALSIPVAVSLAGGYQKDENGSIGPVLDLHDNTFIEAYRAEQITIRAEYNSVRLELNTNLGLNIPDRSDLDFMKPGSLWYDLVYQDEEMMETFLVQMAESRAPHETFRKYAKDMFGEEYWIRVNELSKKHDLLKPYREGDDGGGVMYMLWCEEEGERMFNTFRNILKNANDFESFKADVRKSLDDYWIEHAQTILQNHPELRFTLEQLIKISESKT